MTVTYTAEVATCRGFGCFLKLLLRWRASIYKLVWLDLALFLSLYYALSFVYRFILNEGNKRTFESIVHYCNSYGSVIPLSFVLGFFVSIVMERWWSQYMTIPWPDSIAVFVSAHIHGQDERGRVMRRTIMRYVCLSLTIVLTMISPRVKKRFPTYEHLVDAGLLLENENKVIEGLTNNFPLYSKHWLGIVWAASIVTRARKEGRIRDDFAVKTIIDALNHFRGQCGVLMYFNTISIPLVYTQVVTVAVYSYLLCNVIGHQWTERDKLEGVAVIIDSYFPLFTTLQFFFYMGWLKVAESLMNPFGEDDDDFEVNWMIDRNLQVSYLIVDDMHHEHPQLVRDQYWDEVFPNELPYTADDQRDKPPEPSTGRLDYRKDFALDKQPSAAINGKLRGAPSNIRPQNLGVVSSVFRHFLNRDAINIDQQAPDSSVDAEVPLITANVTPAAGVAKSVGTRPSGTVRIIDEKYDGQTATDLQQQEQTQSESISSFHSIDDEDEDVVDDKGKDEFKRLKEERVRERIERQKKKLVRNIGNATNLTAPAPEPSPPVSRDGSHESTDHQAQDGTQASEADDTDKKDNSKA